MDPSGISLSNHMYDSARLYSHALLSAFYLDTFLGEKVWISQCGVTTNVAASKSKLPFEDLTQTNAT